MPSPQPYVALLRGGSREPPRRLGARAGALVLTAAAAVAAAGALAPAAEKPKDIPGSRFTYIHRLPLLDADAKPIKTDDPMPMPFSYKGTCTKCHEYETVRQGWHFNAADAKVPPGRPGQPWFVIDRRTGTQIPVSYRAWPNTWRPEAVGLKPWKFIQTFGRHTPGGGPGEMTDVEDPQARWLVGGSLGINCAACHSGDPTYDHIEWFLQVAGQNLMWAAAATTDLATVTGAARSMPDTYDPLMGPEDERTAKNAPTLKYNKTKFDDKGRVFFNLPNQPPDNRCQFCHSIREVGRFSPDVWKTDQDVHLASGLTCTDCHRHGLDHQVKRGYEGEPGDETSPHLATLTCRGCHLGDPSAPADPDRIAGRLGAPVPKHVGLPTVHLERLTCTACHSGLYPRERTSRVQTSMAHALEFQGDFRGDDALPYMVEPVYARRAYDGKIGPQRMVWPAFWARLDEGKVTPLASDDVYTAAKAEFDKKTDDGKATPLGAEKVAAVLAVLAKQEGAKGQPVYVSGGKVHRLAADGKLEAAAHEAAEPAAWPVAHDVRPAARSLGSGGCTDCHAADSPMAFGQVVIETPANLGPPETKGMYAFQGRDPTQLWAWAMSYQFRPMFKAVGFATAALIGAVLLLYVLQGLAAFLRWAARKAPQG